MEAIVFELCKQLLPCDVKCVNSIDIVWLLVISVTTLPFENYVWSLLLLPCQRQGCHIFKWLPLQH